MNNVSRFKLKRLVFISETKVTTESAFNRHHFGIEGNYESDSDGVTRHTRDLSCFRYVSKCATSYLTLKLRKTCI